MDYLVEYLEEEEVNPKKRKSARKQIFSSEEKKKLARLVEERPAIWDLGNKGHSNLEEVNSNWRYIAIDMDKTVFDCKAAWKSLRDSLRYHTVAKKKGKSGSAALDYSQDENLPEESTIDWEFSDCLSFLTPLSEKRKTFSSTDEFDVEQGTPNDSNLETELPTSSYTYNLKPKKKDPMLENVSTLTETVAELISLRKNDVSTQPLTHFALLANLDRVLKQLPSDVVEDLGLSFQQQAVAELRKLRSPGF